MPNILIDELDTTTYLSRDITNDHVVLIVGNILSNDKIKLYRNLNSLITDTRDGVVPIGTYDDNGDFIAPDGWSNDEVIIWEYAANMIRLGFPALVYSTANVTSEDYSELKDRIKYKIKFIPTITHTGTSIEESFYGKMLKIVDPNQHIDDDTDDGIIPRGDAFIFYDAATSTEDDDIIDNVINISGTSYVGVAYPAGSFTSPITGNTLTMPASFFVLKTIAEGVRRGYPIYSIWAGSQRGVISDVNSFTSEISNQFMQKLDKVAGIIPMLNVPPYGNLIFGDRTRLNPGVITMGEHTYDEPAVTFYEGSLLNFTNDKFVVDIPTGNLNNIKIKLVVGGVEFVGDVPTSSGSITISELDSSLGISLTRNNNNTITITDTGTSNITRVALSYNREVTKEYSEITANTTKSALDSLNVRLTANEIKKAIFDICLGLSFETNDYVLWSQFTLKLSKVLDAMKESRAVKDYIILMDQTTVTDQDQLEQRVPGKVKVIINRAAKYFDIDFELKPSGAVLTENY